MGRNLRDERVNQISFWSGEKEVFGIPPEVSASGGFFDFVGLFKKRSSSGIFVEELQESGINLIKFFFINKPLLLNSWSTLI
jgi:hypothetical protein